MISYEVISKLKLDRRKGYSISELSRKYGLSKSSVFRVVSEETILNEYREEWLAKRGGSNKRKDLKVKNAFIKASKFLEELGSKEKIVLLSALYWAEGAKKDFSFSNTDPSMVKVFVTLLRDSLGINPQDFRISIRVYEDLEIEKCKDFWSDITDVPKEHFVGVDVLKGKKFGKLKYGMCRVRVVKGGDYLKYINAINKRVEEIVYRPS